MNHPEENLKHAQEALDSVYLRELVGELTRLIDDEDAVDPVTGAFVMLQRDSGRIYPHYVGKCDAVRMIGVGQVYLGREAERQFGHWTSKACARHVLEGGF